MTRGTIISYHSDGQTGYVKPDDDDDKIPFDRKSLVDFPRGEDPQAGDRVSFKIEGGMAGLWATHVRRLG
jgi:cold shock CspA family protein